MEMHRPWSEIRQRFAEMVPGLDLRWMRALVDHLEQSGKAKHLYGFTSMFALVISQTPPTHPNWPPHLRIEPMKDGTLDFRFVDSWRPEDQWHRNVAGPDGVPRLESFFEQLRWFGGAKDQQ